MAKVKHYRVREENGCLYPNDVKGWCFPNWFNKEHFEGFIDRKLTDDEFEVLKEEVTDSLCNAISEDVAIFLQDYATEILSNNREG